MSTAQDLPAPYGEPAHGVALRLVPRTVLDFDEAVRSIRPRLHRYAVRRLGDAHEAEELVQEALLRAYSHRAQLLTEDDLAAWTTVVTGRLVIDRLRVRGRSTSVADVPETGRRSRDTADIVVARDEARTALDALDAMPPRQAALLWAREVEGRSYDDLCTRFGMTEPAVRSVLTRARKALRKEYASRGGTLPVGGLAVLAPWVTGLGWADRLRRAAGRVTGPAALSAMGITALGGLVLSPFGALPWAPAPGFTPAQTVVTTLEVEAPHHGFVAVPVSRVVAVQRTVPRPESTDLTAKVRRTLGTCVNDTDADDGNDSLPITVITSVAPPLDPTAGSGKCDAAESTPGHDVTVHLPGPASGQDPTVTLPSRISCTPVPDNPLVTCDSPQQGASR